MGPGVFVFLALIFLSVPLEVWGQELFIGPAGQLSNPAIDAQNRVQIPGGISRPLVELLIEQESQALRRGRRERLQSGPVVHSIPLRPDLPGAHRHPFGIQIHASCLGENPEQRAERINHFNRVFGETLRSVFNCQKQYPSLKPILEDWIIQARRGVVLCSDQNMTEDDVLATTIPYSDAHTDLSAHDQAMLRDIPVDVFHWQTAMILRNGNSPHLLEHNSTTYFHEFLHDTPNNNRPQSEHRQHQGDPFSVKDPCGTSGILDRTMLVQGLCMGTGQHQNPLGNRPNAEDIFYRVSQCGPTLGCVNLFTSRNNTLTQSESCRFSPESCLPSSNFSEVNAQALCSEILRTGQCLRQRNEWFVGGRHSRSGAERSRAFDGRENNLDLRRFYDPLTRFTPSLVALEPELRERLARIYPRFDHELPQVFFEGGASSREFLRNFAQNRCFQSVFQSNYRGGLYLSPLALSQGPTAGRAYDQIFFRFRERGSVLGHFERLRQTALNAMRRVPACTADMIASATTALSESQNFLMRLDQQNDFMSAARARAASGGEVFAGNNAEWLGVTGDWLERETLTMEHLVSVFGQDLMTRYTAALERFHPDSTQFACSTLTGRSGVVAAWDSLNLVTRWNQLAAPEVCP